MRSEKLDYAKAYLDLVAIRMYQRLAEDAEQANLYWLHEKSLDRIAALEDEYARLTGRRLDT